MNISAALILRLAADLEDAGSWAGETHFQKCLYLLQEGVGIPAGCNFVLYKHGPYSFDLHSELESLLAHGWLELVPRPAPYGPSIRISDHKNPEVDEALRKVGDDVASDIEMISRQFGTQGVAELERVSTALFAIKSLPKASEEQMLDFIVSKKPHIAREDATEALHALSAILPSVEHDTFCSNRNRVQDQLTSQPPA